MNIKTLLLSIGIAIIGFWLLGIVLKLTAWLLGLVLFIGLILVIASLIKQYSNGKK